MADQANVFDQFRQNMLLSIGEQKLTLIVSGFLITLLGIAAIVMPIVVADALLWLMGIFFLASGLIKVGQWLIGRWRGGHRVHGLFAIGLQTVADIVIGIVLLNRSALTFSALVIVIGLALLADGLVQFLIAIRAGQLRHRWVLFVSGVATCIVAIFALIYCNDVRMADWLGYIIGGKLASFGVVLLFMGLTAHGDHENKIYGAPAHQHITPVRGEAYAVFIGNAFHLGLYVGDNHIVDFRDTNMVYKVTWEQFLIGRDPQHYQYPDLPIVPVDDVCKFALEQVGQTHQYNFIGFNCEHFVIWCKSLGKVKNSAYAQIAVAIESIDGNPIFGPVMEIYSRIAEWFAFKMGGAFGKKVSLQLRWFNSLVAKSLLTIRLGKQTPKNNTENTNN